MHDEIPSFEQVTAGLPTFEQITAGMPSFDDICQGLTFPLDEPAFDAANDPEVNTGIRLPIDLTHMRHAAGRKMADFRKGNPDAMKILHDLPGPGESLHGVLSGRFALFDLIPALINVTDQPIDDLTLATLSFSKYNAADLLNLIDAGKVKNVGLLISYFFKAQNRPLYDALVPQLRELGFPVLSMRVHAKLILARMADGTKYVIESSANLRSCDNVEIFVMTRDDALYDFHHQWIYGQFLTGKELRKD
jgi:hypothetical protein